LLRFHRLEGISPEIELLERSIICNFDELASDAGMDPSIMLFDMINI
jgi:hypothetical protein